jgi:hypothetical protein
MAAATSTASTVAPVVLEETNTLFRTSFLRDGSTGRCFAIVQGPDSISSLQWTVYERTSDAFGSNTFSGQADGNLFSFLITKGSTYFIVASYGSEQWHFLVDPNKRRLNASTLKKRAAPEAAASDAAAPATSAATSDAPAAPEKLKDAPKARESKKAKQAATPIVA